MRDSEMKKIKIFAEPSGAESAAPCACAGRLSKR